MRSFSEDLRAVLKPTCKWHYIFHFLVVLVAISYWIGSMVKLSDASWAEIAMYRHRGDNQVYPVITALSRLNFGDPTDSIHYGKGLAGSQVAPLVPYAMAYAVFGIPGYMIADGVLSWMYFVAAVMLLRRLNFGEFTSLFLASALATRSLQLLCAKLSESFGAILSLSPLSGTWEWGFPDLLNLHIFVQRIPRPVATEIFVVFLFYFLIQIWHDRRLPTFRMGFVLGGLLIMLMQGDPFTVAAVGLLLLWVFGWTTAANNWRIPWACVGGSLVGTLAFGWFFILQRFYEHPDSVVRFGMADYPRSKILFLPGYGPLIRVGVVFILAGLVLWVVQRISKQKQAESSPSPEPKKTPRKETKTVDTPVPSNGRKGITMERSIATFCVALVVAGWLAQPIQLLLLGKGSQIYHYLVFVLPTLYSYAVVLLLFTFMKLALPAEVPEIIRKFGQRPTWPGAMFLVLFLTMVALVGMENKILTVSYLTSARQETNVPWAQGGNLYRPCFRALDKQFRQNPLLKESRSFATICYEVNFLLAAFHDKRAYLPDNAYSTLSDEELEDRLLELLKIVQLPQEEFPGFIQANFVLNYWLGCAKYWLTSDYQYSTRDDYTETEWADFQKQEKQTPWILCLPQSEMKRLSEKYAAVLKAETDRSKHPDTIIVGLEKNLGVFPQPQWYQEVYTNQLFSVYAKRPQ